jgi:hypothetical protein
MLFARSIKPLAGAADAGYRLWELSYSFVLTSLAFRSLDGYPLERYAVDFKTVDRR